MSARRLPFYRVLRVGVLVWLALPQFRVRRLAAQLRRPLASQPDNQPARHAACLAARLGSVCATARPRLVCHVLLLAACGPHLATCFPVCFLLLQGATFLYHEFVRPFLLVAVEQAKQLPALEPYVRGFVAGKVRGKGAVQLGCWHGGTVLVFGE